MQPRTLYPKHRAAALTLLSCWELRQLHGQLAAPGGKMIERPHLDAADIASGTARQMHSNETELTGFFIDDSSRGERAFQPRRRLMTTMSLVLIGAIFF